MQQTIGHRPGLAPMGLGVGLIVVGAVALVVRELGFNFSNAIGEWGWPLFVIVPGLVLLAASIVPAPPRGLGFAIAGAIVTTVGALLMYQNQSGHWESWAYAWALLPIAAGLALMLYGTAFAHSRDLITTGLWIAGIAAIILALGAWYFEGIFAGEPRPIDVANSWPLLVIAIGGLLTAVALFGPRAATPTTQPPATQPPTEA